jgi:hypothetical protein
MPFLSVKTEMNQAAREFAQLRRILPTLTRNAINRVATLAEREAMAQVAKDIRLPQRFIRNRYDVSGHAKGRRAHIKRATTARLDASIEVYVRGLPVFQVAGKDIRRKGGGVKAQGGRFYPGAFRPPRYKGGRLVFKRMTARRTPLMMPKIGVRERLTKAFDQRISGSDGLAIFRREYAEQLRKGAARYGVRA